MSLIQGCGLFAQANIICNLLYILNNIFYQLRWHSYCNTSIKAGNFLMGDCKHAPLND